MTIKSSKNNKKIYKGKRKIGNEKSEHINTTEEMKEIFNSSENHTVNQPQMTAQYMSPSNMLPPQQSMPQFVDPSQFQQQQHFAPQYVEPYGFNPNQQMPEQFAPQQMPGQFGPQQMPGQFGPNQFGPNQFGPNQFGPQQMPGQFGPNQFGPQMPGQFGPQQMMGNNDVDGMMVNPLNVVNNGSKQSNNSFLNQGPPVSFNGQSAPAFNNNVAASFDNNQYQQQQQQQVAGFESQTGQDNYNLANLAKLSNKQRQLHF